MSVLKPSTGWRAVDFAELWRYRDLFWFLAWRDVKVRYKQTLLGGGWAVVQPLATMVVFSIFFGGLARVPSDGVPYPLFAFCALLPWQLFAFTLNQAGNCLVANHTLVTKVYFPRLVLPAATLVCGFLDLAIASVVLGGMLIYYGSAPTLSILTLPLWLLMAAAASLGAGLWLAALNALYRDVRHVIPFLTQILLFLTPIAYPSSLVPAAWRPLYGLNPMAGVVEGFRWALLGTTDGPSTMTAVSAVSALVLLASGVFFFRRMERSFADLV